jgi:hypothetical protein
MTQKFDRWRAIPDVVEPFVGISVVSRGDGETALYLHADGRDLRVTFKQIWALTIHEEFAHPHVDSQDDLPVFTSNAGPYPMGAYPLLIVRNSEWLRSFSDSRLAGLTVIPTHYQFISMSYIVDVLSVLRPDVAWVDQAPIEDGDAILRDAGA